MKLFSILLAAVFTFQVNAESIYFESFEKASTSQKLMILDALVNAELGDGFEANQMNVVKKWLGEALVAANINNTKTEITGFKCTPLNAMMNCVLSLLNYDVDSNGYPAENMTESGARVEFNVERVQNNPRRWKATVMNVLLAG